MDAEVLQAIFLHYIGVKWSVFFKRMITQICENADAWKSSQTEIPKDDRLRRLYFLGNKGTGIYNTLAAKRSSLHRQKYFGHQLLDFDTQQIETQDGEEEAEFGDYVRSNPSKVGRAKQTARKSTDGQALRKQLASKAARMSAPSRAMRLFSQEAEVSEVDDEEEEEAEEEEYGHYEESHSQPAIKRPMEAKQELLHLLATEIIVNKSLYGELTCFRTAFEDWNPLLPHETVLAVLKFFGVSQKWLSFFSTFLKAPLKFAEDDASAEPRLRRRGAPGSYALSDMLGETVFFCLDFAVNRATNGAMIHRLYDDVWFWNRDYEKCAEAWSAVNAFADVMGVEVRIDVESPYKGSLLISI